MMVSAVENAWISLAVAIVFGVLGSAAMKLSNGLHSIKYVIYLSFFYIISFVALTVAIKHLDLSIVYAAWSGMGTILTAAIGVFYFNETYSWRKMFFLLLIVVGVIGILGL